MAEAAKKERIPDPIPDPPKPLEVKDKLKKLAEEIYLSWIKDLDKVNELIEVNKILSDIIDKNEIEDYFQKPEDFNYFINEFSQKTISYILRMSIVYGENGEQNAFSILQKYVTLFIKYMNNKQKTQKYQKLFDSIKEIFDISKQFYQYTQMKQGIKTQKYKSSDDFNMEFLKRKEEIELEPDKEIDILINSKEHYSSKVWVRGVICNVINDSITIKAGEDSKIYVLKIGSFEYNKPGSMTPDWDWRSNLQVGDIIDCYDRKKFYPSTILERNETSMKGMKFYHYRVSFRVYKDKVEDIEKYRMFWKDKAIAEDKEGKLYLGDPSTYDETIPMYSRRLQARDSKIWNIKNGTDNFNLYNEGEDKYLIDELIDSIDKEGKKTVIVGRKEQGSVRSKTVYEYYFNLILKFFAENGGYEKLFNILEGSCTNNEPITQLESKSDNEINTDEKKESGNIMEESYTPEIIQMAFYILKASFESLYYPIAIEYAKKIEEDINNFIDNMTNTQLRNLKKETIDLINELLEAYLPLIYKDSNELNEKNQQISLKLSIKMLKTSYLDKRTKALKQINDLIKGVRYETEKEAQLLNLLEKNEIINEIFGSNSHFQLISKSKELLEFLFKNNKIKNEELELIWSCTKNGDLESKNIILKIINEISSCLSDENIKNILNKIIDVDMKTDNTGITSKNNNFNDNLSNEEIDLVYEFSTKLNEMDVVKNCIEFFISCLVKGNREFNKKFSESIINKIYSITQIHKELMETTLNSAINFIQNNENANVGFEIIKLYLEKEYCNTTNTTALTQEDSIQSINLSRSIIEELLIKDDKLNKLFIDNLNKYSENIMKEKEDILKSNLKLKIHNETMNNKLNFLNLIIKLNLWTIPDVEPIDLLYNKLVLNKLTNNDDNLFYTWIKSIIEQNCSIEKELKIFDLFNNKICLNNTTSLSYEGFETYYKIFIDVNYKENLIEINNPNGSSGDNNKVDENISNIIIKDSPLKFKKFDTLWNIIILTKSEKILNKGVEILNKFFSAKQEYLQELVNLCYKEIKRENISTSIKILIKIIEESEKYGTCNIVAHSSLNKQNLITLNISNNLQFYQDESSKDFTISVYSNTTIYDIKKLITQKVKIHFDFIKFEIKNYIHPQSSQAGKDNSSYEILLTDNGKTLSTLNISSGTTIQISNNNMEKSIPNKPLLLSQNIVNPELIDLFIDCFRTYSINGKMSKETCAKFVKDVTNSREEIPPSDHRINDLFNERDANRDGLLEKEEFVKWYADSTIQKERLVYDNIIALNYRNDFKKLTDPYYAENNIKLNMPRYQFGVNDNLINNIFDILIKDNVCDKDKQEMFDFVGMLTTNETIYKSIINEKNDKDFWVKLLLNENNTYKVIYYIQIIDYIINNINEDLEEEDILLYKKWTKNFILNDGYVNLIELLISKINNIDNKNSTNFILFRYLIKLIKSLYISAIDSINQKVNNPQSKIIKFLIDESKDSCQLNTKIINSFTNESIITELINKIDKFLTQNEVEIVSEIFELITILIPNISSDTKDNKYDEYLIKFIEFGIFNNNNEIKKSFLNSIIRMSEILLNKDNDNNIIKNIIKFLISFYKEEKKDKVLTVEYFELFGYLLSKFDSKKHEDFYKEMSFDTNEFIIKIAKKLEIELTLKFKTEAEPLNEEKENEKEEKQKENELSQTQLIGYVKIISTIIDSDIDIKKSILDNTNLFDLILSKVLSNQSQLESSKNLLSKGVIPTLKFINKFIDIDSTLSKSKSIFENPMIRDNFYSFLLSMMNNSLENFQKFFNLSMKTDSQDSSSNSQAPSANEASSRYYSKSNSKKSYGFVGLKNLGCICYMNATMQQFFNCTTLRYSLLRFSDNIPIDNSSQRKGKSVTTEDDNMFHQVQKMFSYLELSNREDYNPFGFTYAFKDFDGLPTKLSEQKDAQEFLAIFLDRIEQSAKNSDFKYLTHNVFGGKNCSQVKCLSCGFISNRNDDLLFLSLPVRSLKTLNESLDTFIQSEKIDGYQCDGCKKKVSISKRNLIGILPNILIIHLQRICYSFEYDRNEKINSRLEFPRKLNMKYYTNEGLNELEELQDNQNQTKKETKDEEGTNEPNSDSGSNDEIYIRDDEYYNYTLVGVIVHIGSADSGHYYSYINTIRDGKGNIASFTYVDDVKFDESWLEFNDSRISKFNVEKLEDQCFGGADTESSTLHFWGGENCKNAYMLVYERKVKMPMKIIIKNYQPQPEDKNLVTLNEENQKEKNKLLKYYDIMRFNYKSKEFSDKCEELYSKIFYDTKNKEYFKYEPFYFESRKLPQIFYDEVTKDNLNLEKYQNLSDDKFKLFFDKMTMLFEENISNKEKNLSENDTENFKRASLDFIQYIFSTSTNKVKIEFLPKAFEQLERLCSNCDKFSDCIWIYLNKDMDKIINLLLNSNDNIVISSTNLVYKMLSQLHSRNPNEFFDIFHTLSTHAVPELEKPDNYIMNSINNLFNSLFKKLPSVDNSILISIEPVLKMLYNISKLDICIYEFYNSKEFIGFFTTFLLLKESPIDKFLPYFQETHNAYRPNIKGINYIADIIFNIFQLLSSGALNIPINEDDFKCIKSIEFLKFLFQHSPEHLEKILLILATKNIKNSYVVVYELLKFLDEMNYDYSKKEYSKLLNIILTVLSIDDEYQTMRFELAFGYPQNIIKLTDDYVFQITSYNLITENENEIYKAQTPNEKNGGVNNLISKIAYESKKNINCAEKTLLNILIACKNCKKMYLYFKNFPSLSFKYNNFIEWCMDSLLNDNQANNNKKVKILNEYNEINQLYNENNEELGNQVGKDNVDYKFFNKTLLIKDIKKIELSLKKIISDKKFIEDDDEDGESAAVPSQEIENSEKESNELKNKLYLIQLDYYADYIENMNTVTDRINLDISKSKMRKYISYPNIDYYKNKALKSREKELEPIEGSQKKIEEEKIEESNEKIKIVKTDEVSFDSEEKLCDDILLYLIKENYEKVIFINTKEDIKDNKNILRSYNIINTTKKNIGVNLKIVHTKTNENEYNEYLCNCTNKFLIEPASIMKAYNMMKFNPNNEWTIDEDIIEFSAEIKERSKANPKFFDI